MTELLHSQGLRTLVLRVIAAFCSPVLLCGCGAVFTPDVASSTASAPLKVHDLSIMLPTSTLGVGRTLLGTVQLSSPSPVRVEVLLSSSSGSNVSVTPTRMFVEPGSSSASFTYAGVSAGESTVSAVAPGYSSAAVQVAVLDVTLRQAAARSRILIGAAADAGEFGYPDPLLLDPLYGSTLSAQFSMLEPENAMKWIVLHPEQNTYDFGPGDELLAFGLAHGMRVRGHNLCWDQYNPDWLTSMSTSAPDTLAALLHDHISSVVSHYKGRVFAWDVVNEAVSDAATGTNVAMKDSIWYNMPGIGLPGTGYVEKAFQWAHQADPDALLFYNEYDIYTPSPKADAVYAMLSDFVKRGVPVDGLGMEMHLGLGTYPDSAGLAQTISRFTSLGLQVHITEMDVALPVDAMSVATSSNLQFQAQEYARILGVCLANSGCTAFQTWGFTDKRSWIPASYPGLGDALLFDQTYQAKPAFYSLLDELMGAPASPGVVTPSSR